MSKPLDLDQIFSFVREKGPVMVAVSGGSDSLAALYLTNAWAKKHNREIHAVTVDHGLRSEAAAEAAFVAMICDRLEIIHTTLAWDGVKPASGISAAARNARYELIEEFASDIGVRAIITGHTMDDQAETVLMRMRREGGDKLSGNRGHAGMCRRTLLSGGTIMLRPFLGVTREQLRQYLKDISQSWVEDPSNLDDLYERVRVRKELELDPERKYALIQYASVMGAWRQAVAGKAAEWLFEHCRFNEAHQFSVDLEPIHNAPVQVTSLALKTIIASAGGGQYVVSDAKIEQIFVAIKKNEDVADRSRLTMGNCIVEIRSDELRIYREGRNLRSALIAANDKSIWDGRVRIVNDSNENIVIGPMPVETMNELKSGDHAVLKDVPRALLQTSPVVTLSSGEQIPVHFESLALPDQVEVSSCAVAIEQFCPEWDYALLDWVKNIDIQTGRKGILDRFDSEC